MGKLLIYLVIDGHAVGEGGIKILNIKVYFSNILHSNGIRLFQLNSTPPPPTPPPKKKKKERKKVKLKTFVTELNKIFVS